MWCDTHCHLTAPEWTVNLSDVLAQAAAVGVQQFVVPAARVGDWQNVLSLVHLPEIVAVAIGIHPWFADECRDDNVAQLRHYLSQNPRVWVGEIGLDFRHAIARDVQINALCQQLHIAQTLRRPIILHNVKAHAALLQAIDDIGFDSGGIVHAFSGSLEIAKQFIQRGFYIGLGSLLLNPNAKKIRQLAQHLPLEAILLETDSPYMLPHHSNTPANIAPIAQIICDIRAISPETLAAQCKQNLTNLLHYHSIDD